MNDIEEKLKEAIKSMVREAIFDAAYHLLKRVTAITTTAAIIMCVLWWRFRWLIDVSNDPVFRGLLACGMVFVSVVIGGFVSTVFWSWLKPDKKPEQ